MQRYTGQDPGKGLIAAMASPVLLSLRTSTKFTLIKYVWLTVSLLKFFFSRNGYIYICLNIKVHFYFIVSHYSVQS